MAYKNNAREDNFKEDKDQRLDTKATTFLVRSQEQQLVASFEEINEFYKKNKRAPKEGSITETSLYSRLNVFKTDPTQLAILMKYDVHGLFRAVIEKKYQLVSDLPNAEEAVIPSSDARIEKAEEPVHAPIQRTEESTIEMESAPIDEVLNNEILGILETIDGCVFKLKHVSIVDKKTTKRDVVVRRKECKDFTKFDSILLQCQKDLANKKRKMIDFSKEQQIGKGYFFLLGGVLLYVAQVGNREIINGKVNARLRCVFEDGTESEMLLRSLAAELYIDGKTVTAQLVFETN